MGGSITYVDLVDSEYFSMHEIDAMVQEIGYSEDDIMYYHFLKPGYDLDFGLLALGNDQDVINMLKYVANDRLIEVYIEHGVTTLKNHWRSPKQPQVEIIELSDDEPVAKVVRPKKKSAKRLLLEWDEKCNVGQGSRIDSNLGVKENGGVEDNPFDDDIFRDDDYVNCVGNDVEDNGEEEEVVQNDVEDNGEEEELDANVDEVGEEATVGDNVQEKVGEETMEDNEEHNKIHEVHVDMTDFRLEVEKDAEGFGMGIQPQIGNVLFDDDTIGINFDEYDSGDGENKLERARKMRLKKLRRAQVGQTEMMKTNFYIGQSFTTKAHVTEFVRAHAVESRRDLKIIKNDHERVRVRCYGHTPGYKPCIKEKKINISTPNEKGSNSMKKSGETKLKGKNVSSPKGKGGKKQNNESEDIKGKKVSSPKPKPIPDNPSCPWTLLVSKVGEEESWLVKTLIEDHKCLPKRHLKQCNSTFLSKQIGDTVANTPGIKGKALEELLSKQFQLGFKKMTIYRAKEKALVRMRGDYQQQYGLLRDYILELQATNPNTTVKLAVQPEPNPHSETRVFKRVYVCLGPLKAGFKACKREILGLDGAFMKGPYPGQVLTAVGVDANNGIYPLAYAVVEAETTNSWVWFLEAIADDLELPTNNANFTFISDRQKVIYFDIRL